MKTPSERAKRSTAGRTSHMPDASVVELEAAITQSIEDAVAEEREAWASLWSAYRKAYEQSAHGPDDIETGRAWANLTRRAEIRARTDSADPNHIHLTPAEERQAFGGSATCPTCGSDDPDVSRTVHAGDLSYLCVDWWHHFHDQPEAGDAFGDAEALAEAGDPVPPKAYRVETKHCTFETDDPYAAALAMKVFGDRAEMPAKE